MKNLCIAIVLAGALASGANFAQQEDGNATDPAAPPPIPPIPPKITAEEDVPVVTISEREGDRVEEYSRNGRVYMVKITPSRGLPYYYLDEDGDGQLEIHDSSNGQGPVRPVFWKIKEW